MSTRAVAITCMSLIAARVFGIPFVPFASNILVVRCPGLAFVGVLGCEIRDEVEEIEDR